MKRHWTLEDIRWQDFDPSKVDAGVLCAVKAAALVEFNAPDYVTYLCNVFADRPDVKEMLVGWGKEEIQHGQALARWAELADPTFNFEAAFKRFQAGYRIPLNEMQSVRGSRAGELVARCVVESGTSSYYTAIKDATDEPVLRRMNSVTTSFSMNSSRRWTRLCPPVCDAPRLHSAACRKPMMMNCLTPITLPMRQMMAACLMSARSLRALMKRAPSRFIAVSIRIVWWRWSARPSV